MFDILNTECKEKKKYNHRYKMMIQLFTIGQHRELDTKNNCKRLLSVI